MLLVQQPTHVSKTILFVLSHITLPPVPASQSLSPLSRTSRPESLRLPLTAQIYFLFPQPLGSGKKKQTKNKPNQTKQKQNTLLLLIGP